MCLASGVACVLRQFDAQVTAQYVELLLQLVRALLHTAFTGGASTKPVEPPADATTLIQYLELFARHTGVDVPGLHLYQSAVGLMH